MDHTLLDDEATVSRPEGPLDKFKEAKKRQLTLRNSWAIQRLKTLGSTTGLVRTGSSRSRKKKVRMVKREHYSPKQKASVHRASKVVKDWE